MLQVNKAARPQKCQYIELANSSSGRKIVIAFTAPYDYLGVQHFFLGLHKDDKKSPPSNEKLEFSDFVAGGDLDSGLRFARINLIGKRHYTSSFVGTRQVNS